MIRMQSPLPTLLLLTLTLAAGCAHSGSPAFPASREPRVIAIRNATPRPLESFALQEDHDASDSPRRIGAISPLVPYHTYAFRRLPDAPALPQRLRVIYRYPNFPPKTVLADLRPIVQQSKGDSNEAIVFELQPDGSVKTFLDHIQP